VDRLAFEHHLTSPQGQGHVPDHGHTVTRGGGSCCDTITFTLALDGSTVIDAGYEARGCGGAIAAGSAAVTLVRGQPLMSAARVGVGEIAAELGGLSPGKLHAADLAADALARALGAAVSAHRPAGAVLPAVAEGRTLVAMSGGVDSAVAARECMAVGETVAVTLELWADHENDAQRSCCSASAVAQARSVAHAMGLAHFTLDLREDFRRGVVEPFIAGYAQGETPNPCVGCNGHVRLDALLRFADRLGCDTLATGHYARVAEERDPDGPLLRAAADPAKDQTYMLAALAPSSLARMRFPLGELTKPEVRQRARHAGLPVADKPDSQDLCFLAGTDRTRFLARHGGIPERRGEVVDRAGNRLATHRGHHGFTVGQRRGLGVATAAPLYVLEKDSERNRVVVGPRAALRRDTVTIRDVRLHRDGSRVDGVKLRYHQQPLPARLQPLADTGTHPCLRVDLLQPAESVAPGQLACLMAGELIVGWATIDRSRSV